MLPAQRSNLLTSIYTSSPSYTRVYLITAWCGAHINSKLYKFTSFEWFLGTPSGNCYHNETGDSSCHLVATNLTMLDVRAVCIAKYARSSAPMTMKRLNDNNGTPHIGRHYCGLSQCYPQRVQGCTEDVRVRCSGSRYPFKARVASFAMFCRSRGSSAVILQNF